MVMAENRTSRPWTGWIQVLAARSRMVALSCPRGGGELSSAPTTEKRKRAHKEPLDGWLVISRLLEKQVKDRDDLLSDRPPGWATGIFCGAAKLIRRTRSAAPPRS